MNTIQHQEIVSLLLLLSFQWKPLLGAGVFLIEFWFGVPFVGVRWCLSPRAQRARLRIHTKIWMPNNRKGTEEMKKAVVKGLVGVDQWP